MAREERGRKRYKDEVRNKAHPATPAGLDLPIGTTPAGSRWVSPPGPANHPNPILIVFFVFALG